MVSPCTSLLCYKIDHVHTMTHDTVELKKEGNWFLHTRLPCPLTAQAESWMCNEKNTATSKDKKNIYSRGWRKWQKNIATEVFFFFLFSVFLYFCWQSSCVWKMARSETSCHSTILRGNLHTKIVYIPTCDLCLGETLSIVTPMTLHLPSLSGNLWHSNIPLSMNVRC